MSKLSLNGQITELDWTIDQMSKWHSHRINTRAIKPAEAKLHHEQLMAVLETLNWFADNEPFIRFCFKHRKRIVDEIKEEEINGQGVDGVGRSQ